MDILNLSNEKTKVTIPFNATAVNLKELETGTLYRYVASTNYYMLIQVESEAPEYELSLTTGILIKITNWDYDVYPVKAAHIHIEE